MHVLSSISPVFLLILLGFALRATGFVDAALVRGMSRLAYWVGLPSLLVVKISRTRIDLADQGGAFAILLLGTATTIAAGWLVSRLWGLRGGASGTAVQCAFRGNLAFVGLPVLIWDAAGRGDSGAVESGLILLACVVPVYNVLAVSALLIPQRRRRERAGRELAAQLVTNPLILASLLGASLSIARIAIPVLAARTLESLGEMALPLALLGVGGHLDLRAARGRELALATTTAAIKVALGPLVGYAVARSAGLPAEQVRAVTVLLACPTAAASYVLTAQLGGDVSLAARAVALSTIGSFASLTVAVWAT